MKTVNITDYQIQSPTVAKVIISCTGDPSTQFIREELSRKLNGLAVPVASSFKKLCAGVAVGFIRANKPVRSLSDKEITAGYRNMGSNVLMDKEDNSLWDVKSGATGRYLTRHDQEDLTALMQTAAQRRVDIPRLSQVTIAAAKKNELIAFVDGEGDMDYGVALKTADNAVQVLSFNRRIPQNVNYDRVVAIQPIVVPREIHTQVMAALTPDEKKQANAYWQKLYYWAPDYLRQLQQFVNEGTFL